MAPQNMVSIGDHLRAWRERNRLSQLHCALEADISQRHLSFLETGRSRPSRDMIIHLADRLNIPLRDRNAALLAAGFAPAYSERGLDDPEMKAARAALEQLGAELCFERSHQLGHGLQTHILLARSSRQAAQLGGAGKYPHAGDAIHVISNQWLKLNGHSATFKNKDKRSR